MVRANTRTGQLHQLPSTLICTALDERERGDLPKAAEAAHAALAAALRTEAEPGLLSAILRDADAIATDACLPGDAGTALKELLPKTFASNPGFEERVRTDV